jgi:hypothetical protein
MNNHESHPVDESLAAACVASPSRPRRRAARGAVNKSYAEPDDDPTDEEEDHEDDRYAVATSAAATRRYAVDTSVYKLFPGHGYFWGAITEADESGYKVVYTDGEMENIPMDDAAYDDVSDEEDLREALHEAVAHAEREFQAADAANRNKPTKKARKASAPKHKTAPKRKKAPSRGAAATAKAPKKRKVKDDTDDDDFVEHDGDDDEAKDESLDEHVWEEEDGDEDDDEEEDNGVGPKPKKKGKSMAESFRRPMFRCLIS